MDYGRLIEVILFGLAGVFVLLYFLFGARMYFVFIAFAFAALGLIPLFKNSGPVLRIALVIFAVGALVLAVTDMVRDTRERLVKMRDEQVEREEAFSDLTAALARAEDEKRAGMAQGAKE